MTKRLVVIGECMLELGGDLQAGQLRSSFAGDIYNAGVYAKRWLESLEVSFLTAVGEDCVSDAMLQRWQSEGLDCSLVLKSDNAIPGSYLIHTDAEGERSFVYWRRHSAATRLAQLLRLSGGADRLPDCNCVFFSGISLGILSDEDREYLLEVLSQLRRRGASVAFDPNFRPALWQDVAQAREWISRAYSVADIALPGLEDHEVLYGHRDQLEVLAELEKLGVAESVIKCGAAGVYAFAQGEESAHQPFVPAATQVDSTAAGDSFAGTYLAARLAGSSLGDAIRSASEVAGFVVQHRGAIIALDRYRERFH